MSIGITSRITVRNNDAIYFNFNSIKQEDNPMKEDFQVEFRHIQLILLGYFCAILIVMFIFFVEVLCHAKIKKKLKVIVRKAS